jgi:O-antigen ligase
LTYSRGALLAFLIGLFLLGVMFGKPLARLLYLTTALVAAIVALIYQDKVVAVLSRGRSSGSLTAASGRLMIWASGWRMFLARPLLGWGFIAGVKRHISDFYSNTTFAPQHLHNEFLQGAASGGFLAGLLLVAIFFSLLVQAARHSPATLEQQFLLFVVLQVFFHGLEGPVFSAEFQPVGACALLCLTSLALVDHYGTPRAPLEPLVIEGEIDGYTALTTGQISSRYGSA